MDVSKESKGRPEKQDQAGTKQGKAWPRPHHQNHSFDSHRWTLALLDSRPGTPNLPPPRQWTPLALPPELYLLSPPPTPWYVEKLSSMNLVPGAKKVVDSISIPFKTNVYLFRSLPQELAVLLGSNL